MGNLADEIEGYILQKLAGKTNDIIILQRNELADELSCAPSQISYVLSTRFTIQKGFMVESRRGLGGFVRIVKIPLSEKIHYKINSSADMPYYTVQEMEVLVDRLYSEGIITKREAGMIRLFIQIIDEHLVQDEKISVFRSLLISLVNNS